MHFQCLKNYKIDTITPNSYSTFIFTIPKQFSNFVAENSDQFELATIMIDHTSPHSTRHSILGGNFAAIDFETANSSRSSVCSVGVVIVRDNKIVDRYYSLIRPTPNYYTIWTTRVHGLVKADTDNARSFPEVWNEIAPIIGDLPLVAHNRAFDESCLRAAFDAYGM